MAGTLLSDVIIPLVYLSYTAVDNPELTAFFQSGVVVRNAALDNCFQAGGKQAFMPFWNDLDPTAEPNYSTDSPSDVATPDGVNAQEMITVVANLNKGYSAADLVGQLAGSSPMQQVRNRFGTWWTRQWQRRVLKAAIGLFLENVTPTMGDTNTTASDMVINVALETTVGVDASNLFSRSAFTSAVATMGDHFADLVAIAVHSVVYNRMVQNDDIQFIRPSIVDPNLPLTPEIPYFLGKRVIVDDSMPIIPGSTSGYKYLSVLFGAGAFGYGEQMPPIPVEIYRRPDQGNGGGVEQLWERKSWVLHPFGYQFTSASLSALCPTWADLANPLNWIRVVVRKNVPLAFLVTNG